MPSGAVGLGGALYRDLNDRTRAILTDVECDGTEGRLEECDYSREVVRCIDTNAAVVCQGNQPGSYSLLPLAPWVQ